MMPPPNVAVIFAGGTGQRMNTRTRPKQFLELHGKPILVYTLEHFQNCGEIDGIVLVSLASWRDYCHELIEKYRLDKVKAVIPGGETGQDSIYLGLVKAAELYPDDSVVLIHDGVRPLIDEETILKSIDSVLKNGSSVTTVPATETIILMSGDKTLERTVDRQNCLMAKGPQCFRLGDILSVHKKARLAGSVNYIDSASLMCAYGYKLHAIEGSFENIKITTPADFYIFRALMDARENSQILGL